jgi:NitT/TauT family transport system substrate-binding protein
MSDETSRNVALGWHDDKRMQDTYDLVETYLGLEQKYDIKTAYTNEFLDKSIKMVKVEEPKF